MGEPSTELSSGVKATIDNCFASVNPRVIFTSKSILPIAHKDVVLAIKKSNVIYEFKCHCILPIAHKDVVLALKKSNVIYEFKCHCILPIACKDVVLAIKKSNVIYCMNSSATVTVSM